MSAVYFVFRTQVKQELSRLLAVVFFLVFVATLHSQIVETGVITGVIKDNTGASIPNAQVVVLNTSTGLKSNTPSDSQGIYVSPPLHPGDYNVEVKAPGFSKVVDHVRLEVGQRANADIVLAVGAAEETIEVQAAGQLLDTESSSVGNLRTEQAVKDLPLNGRNFTELLGLGAGVVPAQTQLANVPYVQQRGPSSYAFAGLRYQENRLLLDGIGDNENHNGLGVIIFPPIDAIQEFSEETTDADARYGRGNGGTINLVYKSGTDHYHGEVFEFLRNSALDARNYFDTAGKPPLRLNEFGGTFGGPLFFRQANPKTFFFVDYSGQRLVQGFTDVDTVPDFNLTSTGYDFSAYAQKIKNPRTGAAYANNFIPLSDPSINPTGANILNFYQKYAPPNIAGTTTAINLLYNPVKTLVENAFDVRVDHQITARDSGFLRYSQAHDTIVSPGVLPGPLVGDVISGPAQDPAYQAVLGETHIFSPTRLNTVRFGWSRFFVIATNKDAGLNLPTQLGIPGVEVPGDPLSDGLPVLTFAGNTALGDAANSPTQIGTNNYQFDDNFNLVLGKHSLDIGGEFVRLQYDMFQTSAEHGTMSFGTSYSGLAWTDLLFGAPVSGTYAYQHGTRGFRQSDLAFYVQDNYKVNNRLTVNLGLRYENFLGWPWTEVDNRMYAFDPSISTTSLEQVGTQGIPRSGVKDNKFNFAPRVGFAYKLTDKTVFHAGYGIYYSAPNVANSSGMSVNAPGEDYWAFNNSTTYGANAPNGSSFNFASNGFVHTTVTSASALPIGLPLLATDPNAKTPYSEQWHASIERQIPYSTVLKVAYVGTGGVHLDNLVDINAGSPGTTLVTNSRPYPYFSQINQLQTRQISNYNALQLSVERRAHGLGFLASYSYSHSLDEGTGSPGSVLNPYNLHADYGDSDLNIPNRFVASASYELPFKGAGTLSYFVRGWQLNTILNYSDGLPFSVTSSSGVGDGLTPRAQLVPGNGNGSLPPGKRSISEWFNTSAFVSIPLSPASSPLVTGQWGDSGRNILQGPGTKNVDFSVFKNTHLTTSKTLQLRAEFFNLFNTPQFNNPNATAPTPAAGSTTLVPNITPGSAYGTISSAGSPTSFQRISREIQLAAKITF
ncbi:TonB-dependent receptor [Granulicella sp. S156]|uniref:TonB-dependent receptor n=1 Tax=Granulicella sp. S156 TaxID=1747224 RepID=UPI00131EC241|nr:TonB-dependent receptor [Granulicella sp. S156]